MQPYELIKTTLCSLKENLAFRSAAFRGMGKYSLNCYLDIQMLHIMYQYLSLAFYMLITISVV